MILMNVKEADRAFLVRDSSEDLQVVRSEGSYLLDERAGNTLIS
jgi:hypothetical protein